MSVPSAKMSCCVKSGYVRRGRCFYPFLGSFIDIDYFLEPRKIQIPSDTPVSSLTQSSDLNDSDFPHTRTCANRENQVQHRITASTSCGSASRGHLHFKLETPSVSSIVRKCYWVLPSKRGKP
ncbi:hypothetical protein D8B26_007509 [Coccidioides posadasii str. Silveira]|uniref:Uncharacterized protein n=1 Tax=Coccidioides posadasii (strain RMSCC 757 / Silveira) TaxID=443226 RepID=E9D242_COCPS|nr:hypothetical protein CPSG_03640 [Coccidioides posadasii str. Silveira]QVM12893.1 hypothetical protein D8B26_007509 [Coccidioides posadasii str. Silveira]